jgi:hypothetical protein
MKNNASFGAAVNFRAGLHCGLVLTGEIRSAPHVQFEGGSQRVSMLDMAGIPEPEQDAGIRAAILWLGEAIVQVAKDSHGIVPHHP